MEYNLVTWSIFMVLYKFVRFHLQTDDNLQCGRYHMYALCYYNTV